MSRLSLLMHTWHGERQGVKGLISIYGMSDCPGRGILSPIFSPDTIVFLGSFFLIQIEFLRTESDVCCTDHEAPFVIVILGYTKKTDL